MGRTVRFRLGLTRGPRRRIAFPRARVSRQPVKVPRGLVRVMGRTVRFRLGLTRVTRRRARPRRAPARVTRKEAAFRRPPSHAQTSVTDNPIRPKVRNWFVADRRNMSETERLASRLRDRLIT